MAETDESRRRVLRWAVLSLPALAVTTNARAAAAAPLTPLTTSDPTAKALGFIPNAAKVDLKTDPTFKVGSHCGDCAQFTGKPGAARGPCKIFVGHTVPETGWCRVWIKKP